MSSKYKLINAYEIIEKMRDFSEAHLYFEKSTQWDVANSSDNARIISCVTDCSNGDCCRHDVTTISLGDIEVSVQMLTLKTGDNIEVYLAPYSCGDQDVIAD